MCVESISIQSVGRFYKMKIWTLTYKSTSIKNVGGSREIRKVKKSLTYRVSTENVENVKKSIIDRIKSVMYRRLFIEIRNWLIEVIKLIGAWFL